MAESKIPKSLASEVNAVETSLATKATRVSNSWGTTVSWTFNNAISVLAINRTILALVWTAGSGNDVYVLVMSENGNYQKFGSGSIQFGTRSTDTNYTLTRNGSTLTLTTQSNASIKVFT